MSGAQAELMAWCMGQRENEGNAISLGARKWTSMESYCLSNTFHADIAWREEGNHKNP